MLEIIEELAVRNESQAQEEIKKLKLQLVANEKEIEELKTLSMVKRARMPCRKQYSTWNIFTMLHGEEGIF